MKKTDVIIAGIAGTTAFTLFSYLVAKTMHKNFEEPKLLGKMVDRTAPGFNEEQSQFTGWLMHYLVGISVATAYKSLLSQTGIKPSVKNGAMIGLLSGFPAALLWDSSLKLHPLPPRKRSLDYYVQLAIGHAIFGATAFFVLGFSAKRRNEQDALAPIPDDSAEGKLGLYATAGS